MSNPKVSIILPTYNVELYVQECILSLINQSFNEIEIIVILDGSKDNSENIVNELSKLDERIIIIKQENRGVGISRNRGIEIAKGDYILFVDPDDYLHKDMVKKLYNVAVKNDCDIVQCNYIIDKNANLIKNNYNIIPNKILKKEEIQNEIKNKLIEGSLSTYVWDKMYKKSFLKEYKIEFYNINKFEDWHFIMEVITKMRRYIFIEDNLYYYRILNTGLSKKFHKDYVDLIINIHKSKINYINIWGMDNKIYHSRFIISLYNDIINLLNYIVCERKGLNFQQKLQNIKTIVYDPLIESSFISKNDSIYKVNTNINYAYLKPIFYFIKNKKYIYIYLWIRIYSFLR